MQIRLVCALLLRWSGATRHRELPEVLLAQELGSLLGCLGNDPAQLCQPAPAEPGAPGRGMGKCVSNSSRWHSTLTNLGMNVLGKGREPASLRLSPENAFPD